MERLNLKKLNDVEGKE